MLQPLRRFRELPYQRLDTGASLAASAPSQREPEREPLNQADLPGRLKPATPSATHSYDGLPVMLTIQRMPNLSSSIPNVSPHGAGVSGIVIVAPALSLSQ
jgi:hypothetical protein